MNAVKMPSSVVKRFEYRLPSASLRVWFVSGAVYDYKKVPRQVFNKFKAAVSKGTLPAMPPTFGIVTRLRVG